MICFSWQADSILPSENVKVPPASCRRNSFRSNPGEESIRKLAANWIWHRQPRYPEAQLFRPDSQASQVCV